MKIFFAKSGKILFLAAALSLFSAPAAQTTAQTAARASNEAIAERNVRAHLEFLASDALQGRGSGTLFEHIAGRYIASQLQQFGIEPAGDMENGKHSYLQTVAITRNSFAQAPTLSYAAGGKQVALAHGKEMLALQMNAAEVTGNLQKMTLADKPEKGAIALIRLREGETVQSVFQSAPELLKQGAVALMVEEAPSLRQRWDAIAARPVSFTSIANVQSKASNFIVLSTAAAQALQQAADKTPITIKGTLGAPETKQTWNVVGELKGTDANLSKEVILLSAHMDHLGVREQAPGADKIFNGADDDASGVVAVLELARVLGAGAKPKRTVQFALFGSEEAGGYGAQYFVERLSYPLENLVANLEFEMIGRPDVKVAAEELWLTGYDRSNLGAELARQGARLVADPHPQENFFQRSDNYTLALRGVVAHTVSSFGLHKEYHQPNDDLTMIDFPHMTRSINSLVKPVQWLVNSDFKPAWLPGKKP